MSSIIKILLAEDEISLGTIVKESLESREFSVTLQNDGNSAYESWEEGEYDAVVLDVMMPGMDGFTLAKKIRKKDERIPIIFLTSKSQTKDVVEGFSYGGNDYIKKPFSMEELIVRIEALVGRTRPEQEVKQWVEIGNYQFNFPRQILRIDEEEQNLTYREAVLLNELYQNKNELTDRSTILNEIWGGDDFFNARSMDVFITKLRKKLVSDPNVQIVNLRGYGYKLIC
ncbi:response regulator transcription factor [Marinigracilibium pacificum]|uniref:Response regulator transcription factor n=1 Tax=Marinigracilibium pacificum TaxID=2729599 RepID=A0A848J8Q2_9BACT|nr:response regulator transcription factor [Marinigracilibium pacificum]NMM50870.1 response regulator transcription factor [Marinigracilibium pacificum]